MKIWIIKEELVWLEKMQSEGKTRVIIMSNFRRFDNEEEIEVEIAETLAKHNKDFKTKLEVIYTACNDERVFEIQYRIGDLLKEISSLNHKH